MIVPTVLLAVVAPVLPDTPPGKLFGAWLDSFNSGDHKPAGFAEALRAGKLVSAELAAKITTGKVDTPRGEKYAYGFIDGVVDGKRVTGHGGGAPGMNANLDIFWDTGAVVVVLANRDPPIADQIKDWIRDRIRP